MRFQKFIMVVVCFSTLLFSCSDSPKGRKYTDTYSSGKITIAVDESHKPVIDSEIMAFMAAYPKATIQAKYVSEGEAINLLVQDSARLAIINRPLNEKEKEALKKQQLSPKTLKIATDAVALIVHKGNKDSLLTVEQVGKILKGEIKNWKQISASAKDAEITCVFDNANSANLQYLFSRYNLSLELIKAKVFAAGNNNAVIEYVTQNPQALGFIGVNWISDLDSPRQADFSNQLGIVALADTVNPKTEDYYQPYQAYLGLKKYPFIRELLVVSRESRNGLGSGFMSWCAGDEGQRVILKAGLLPATQPVRVVKLGKKDPTQ